ncbi:nitroreductase family protein [Herminiimonas arsenitoxidans]|uniref:nitroreductase family protein n=1 Tax=Herminiimonas arsenitoxidans TaxID=1809410 RepID=UPI0009F8E5CF|nr:nitroreductase [Herminiimonas arsenitoxidans]
METSLVSTMHMSNTHFVIPPEAVLDHLMTRFSMGIKHLVEPGPNDIQLRQIAHIALRAPDHGELVPFRLCVVQGNGRERLADLFETYARSNDKDDEACAIERERALRAPMSIAVISKVINHPVVPVHEQWACIGGAVTNILNAIHLMGFAGKMLSGEKVRNPLIIDAFCDTNETLLGWISIGTPTKSLGTRHEKSVDAILSYF